MISGSETYIGDGVYASFDGYHVWLRTPRAGGDHKVALELPVFRALFNYIRLEVPHFIRQIEIAEPIE